MFESLLLSQFAKYVGQRAEIGLDNRIIDGVITLVGPDYVTVVESMGYGATPVWIPISAINTVRFFTV
ncbi:hypothetical protein [Priestia flexa]|uniref:hypothetical protein n=1 Tax=Priestia flexa TaxID=86664 RepID=UPI001B3364E9|nr:hypothetical protein [Priestia flexa]